MSDLRPHQLIQAYCMGWFPMSESRNDTKISWYQPQFRGIIPLDQFHMSKNVMRLIKRGGYEVRINSQFEHVLRKCAEREQTWISDTIIRAYAELNKVGHAHSVEIWKGMSMVGGLYGASIARAFFGESMFHTEPEMDKVALWHCHQFLLENGYQLWDTQYYTEHLGRFGCIEIAHDDYMVLLERALRPQDAPEAE